jgi:phosphoenolpyruvate carboxylase
VAAKYARPASARRNLETLLSATLEASCLDADDLGPDHDRFVDATQELSDLAFALGVTRTSIVRRVDPPPG